MSNEKAFCVSEKTKLFLEIVRKNEGRELPEPMLRYKLKMSHGRFSKLRRALYLAGVIEWKRNERGKAVYRLRTPREQKLVPVVRLYRTQGRPMPLLEGVFENVAAWRQTVDERLGNNDISETDVPNVYHVYGEDYGQTRDYYLYPHGTGIAAYAMWGGKLA